MTPAEIAALRDMCKAAEKVGGWPVEVAPHILRALLSALEEARVEAKANMDGWRKANADYMRLKESEDTDTITNAEILGQRDAYFARALAAESRADDLQAELLELRALEMNHEGACVRLKSERDEARARADAAASEARIYANCEAPCSCGSKHRMARLASTIAALPPPSATPNEET